MSEQSPQIPEQFEADPTAYYFESHVSELIGGVVLGKDGSRLRVMSPNGETKSQSTRTMWRHPAEVFTPTELAGIADDLLPAPGDGDEMLLKSAIAETLDDPTKSHELQIRLKVEALDKARKMPLTNRDLGLQTKAELVGSSSERSSNTWKIEELLEGLRNGYYTKGGKNDLHLARPVSANLSLLGPSEAARVATEIDEINRQALDELYDSYDVDFGKATVWDKKEGNYYMRKTIYPTASGQLCFIETHITDNDQHEIVGSPKYVEIEVGTSTNPTDSGFSPAI